MTTKQYHECDAELIHEVSLVYFMFVFEHFKPLKNLVLCGLLLPQNRMTLLIAQPQLP